MKSLHHFEYKELLKIELFCNFDFDNFPFDSHDCDLFFGSNYLSNNYVKLQPPKIGNSEFFETDLPFEIRIQELEAFNINIVGYNYSHSGCKLHLKRNTIGPIVAKFYGPIALFSTLSLMSFSINPKVVSNIFVHFLI